jgi:hypothetical protein
MINETTTMLQAIMITMSENGGWDSASVIIAIEKINMVIINAQIKMGIIKNKGQADFFAIFAVSLYCNRGTQANHKGPV